MRHRLAARAGASLRGWASLQGSHGLRAEREGFPSRCRLMILGLIFLFVYLFIRLLAKFGAWISGTRFRAYRQLAVRYKGRYESRGLSDTPTVSFIHNGSTVRVGLAPTIVGQPEQIPRTRVVARFARGYRFGLELAPAAALPRPSPPRELGWSKLGDPEFDRGFVVQAND